MKQLMIKRLFILLITLGMVGCSAIPPETLKKEYDTHNQNFDKHNVYKEHLVPRGKFHLYAREFNKSL